MTSYGMAVMVMAVIVSLKNPFIIPNISDIISVVNFLNLVDYCFSSNGLIRYMSLRTCQINPFHHVRSIDWIKLIFVTLLSQTGWEYIGIVETGVVSVYD